MEEKNLATEMSHELKAQSKRKEKTYGLCTINYYSNIS